jgi:hypothetical protein
MTEDAALADHYEELRRAVFDQRQTKSRWGYAVLKTKGMVAWVTSWRECSEQHQGPMVPSISAASPLSPSSAELIRVLTGMVLAVQQEARP